jgi:PPM family protein phosphatase
MRVRAHGVTHVGLVRPNNEDAFHVGDWTFAVADGVGGAPAGEVAAGLAVERIAAVDDATPTSPDDAGARLEGAVRDAARAVHDGSNSNPAHAGMATTLTAAGIWDDRLVVAHVGDSRAYHFRDGHLEQRTQDHTVAEEAVRAGLIGRDEAAAHPERHMLVRSLGDRPDVPVATVTPEPLRPGDVVVLCSDGLTEPCDDTAIAEILRSSPEPEAAAERLVEAALAKGGPDNITVVVVSVA